MRVRYLSGLAGFILSLLACSDDGDGSNVTPSDGMGGSTTDGGGGGTGNRAGVGNAPNLGGAIDVGEAGSGAETGMPDLPSEVNVIITADNAYGFGYGTETELLNYFGGVENPDSDDIFACPVGKGPEEYVVPAKDANMGGYLYIVGYADKLVTQGVIAKFFREGATPVYTGMGKWEACATGEDYDPGSGGPEVETINEYITKCNEGELDPATTSVGWVGTDGGEAGRLVFGEDNSTTRDAPVAGNEFLIACDIEASAKWMWFDWLPEREEGSPFLWPSGSGNVTKDFVIFRLGADQVPSKPPK